MSDNWRDWNLSCHTSSEVAQRVAEEFEFFDDDVLINTYYKSGTTMTQYLTSCLLYGCDKAESSVIWSLSPFIDFGCGPKSDMPSPMDMASSLPRPRVLKTHLPPAFHQRHLQKSSGPKTVVVMRNPKDVLVSFFHHLRNLKPLMHICPESFKDYWRSVVYHPVEAQHYDFFDFNLAWWKLRDHPRVKILFYEDIVSDKRAAVKELASFLNVSLTSEQLERTLEIAAFDKMQANSNVNISRIMPEIWTPGFSFIRKGVIGGWKDYFTVAESEELEKIIADRLRGSGLSFRFE